MTLASSAVDRSAWKLVGDEMPGRYIEECKQRFLELGYKNRDAEGEGDEQF